MEQVPDDYWRVYLLCGWRGGLRLEEALQLRREPSGEYPWLDLAGNRIVLPAAFAKSAEDRTSDEIILDEIERIHV